jgi:Zinc finger, C2H2 type
MGTEPDFPYSKKPKEPVDDSIGAPPPMPPPEPPTPPFGTLKFKCPNCGKMFNSKEELTLHMETVHMSPKKKM